MENRESQEIPIQKKKATPLRDLPVPVNKDAEKEQMLRLRKMQMQEEQIKQQRQLQMMEEQQKKMQSKERDDALVERVLSSMQEPSNVNINESNESNVSNEVKPSVNDVQKEEDTKPSSMSDRIVKELKEPIVIAGLAFLSNQTFVTDLLIKHIPKIIDSETKQINTIGFLIKGILVGVLFYVIKKYILK